MVTESMAMGARPCDLRTMSPEDS